MNMNEWRLSRTEWQREKEREEMKKKWADNMKLVGSPFIMISEILLIGQISECLARRSGEQVKPRGRKTSKTLTRHERDATERPSLMKFVKGYATENVRSTKNGNDHPAEEICTILLKKIILGYYSKAEDRLHLLSGLWWPVYRWEWEGESVVLDKKCERGEECSYESSLEQ